MKRRGFTIVELVITITIMGILLTLAVVNLNASQANARDAERKSDAEAIAANLEAYYNNTNSGMSSYNGGGYYLGTQMIGDVSAVRTFLPDLDPKTLRAPGVADSSPISFIAATNNVATVAGVTPQPSASNDVYVYQPLARDNTLCPESSSTNLACVKFNIFYFQESSGTVQMITSRHQ